MRTALFAASLALVAGATLGCGGSDGENDAPADATSEEDFCAAFQDFYTEVSGIAPEETGEQVAALKTFGEDLEELGTPDGMPDDARQGFEVTLEAISEIPDDATQEDISAIEEDFSEEETEQSDAFDAYLDETCGDPSEAPSDGAGEPSDESSE